MVKLESDYTRNVGQMVEAWKKDYKLNTENFDRFVKIVDYFGELAPKTGIRVRSIDLLPTKPCARVVLELPEFLIEGEDYIRFLDTLKNADTFRLRPASKQTVVINVSVNNVWAN